MIRIDYINRMEILISGSAQFENLWVPENNDYNFMVKEKKVN